MSTSILATKLYIPSTQAKLVLRPRLVERLNEGLLPGRKVSILSAPAGFGKTTLVSEWVSSCGRAVAWLSLDEGDNDTIRFLSYLVAALRTIVPEFGVGVLGMLQSISPPPVESILTALLNDISNVPDNFILVLDDYHVIDARPVDQALTFLLKHQPPYMHLVIVTREDPNLPLAQYRARGQMTELRIADLRFTVPEAGEFINQVMGLQLSPEDIDALEARTEGWIAGLQLAAISMRGRKDVAGFIKSFTGTHQFVLDYLLEEVLQQQSESMQSFLLRTSILDQLCGPLCDAVLLDPSAPGQETLESIERANLFLVPLDNERRWYRYHHLFADLLRQRLQQGSASSPEAVTQLHSRASVWYENKGMKIEAFQHAAAAQDVARAGRLIEADGMPLYFRGAVAPVLSWLESLPGTALDAQPSLWVTYASVLLFSGQQTAVEGKLQSAEAALAASLQGSEPDDRTKDLLGRIASLRATLAVMQQEVETILAQSQRALEYLHPDNLSVRTATTWTLGYAYQLLGNRTAARQAYTDIIATSKTHGNSIYTTAATINLAQLQEAENELSLAARTYGRVVELAGDPPQRMACEAYLGLARIHYQWNNLETAREHAAQCLKLVQQMESVNTFASYGVFLARLKLAQRDAAGAAAILTEAEGFVRQHHFMPQMLDVAAARVLALLHQGDLAAAAHLAQSHELPMSQARVHLARGDTSAALAVLELYRGQAEANGWQDERLKVMVLQALALHTQGKRDRAVQMLGDALALAEPGGFLRMFVDEGLPMAELLSEAAAQGSMPGYTGRLLAAFEAEKQDRTGASPSRAPASPQPLIEPLSVRELEVLRLLRSDLSGPEIAGELLVSLNTVRSHTKNIYSKLGANNRRAAVRRAEQLALL